jgi:hypothetical protein
VIVLVDVHRAGEGEEFQDSANSKNARNPRMR